ncbi:MAG: hypothetical protein H6648_11590 [Caldilineae bacterium]|nr:hypothetical protein [Caldilineae bacterium]
MTDFSLKDAFDIPDSISALGFVVRISGEAHKAEDLVQDYVLTPGVRAELERILAALQRTTKRGDDLGWFVHGSFGSGKSHFMAYLGYLLENVPAAWAKDDPTIAALGPKHRDWIADRKLLVVRENLMSAASEGSRFDRLVYEAVNKELRRQGKPAFEFLNVDAVLDEVRRDAELFGEPAWRSLAEAGIVDSREGFEEVAAGSLEEREDLARLYLVHKGRDIASAGFSPSWGEGLHRLTRHVKDQGYGGLVLLLDEMLLWLSGKTGPEYKDAINQLTVVVDHSDGRRALPIAVFVARQRRFSEFFPDMVDEEQLQDQLDFQGGRFEQTTLEDVELRHIVRHRVLRRLRPEAVQATVDRLAEEHKKLLPALLQGADEHYLRDVYPFHPALIEMLIDVSSLLQRDRTALRLLYELLISRSELPLGAFLPVGSAFEKVFPSGGFLGSRRVEQLRAIQTLYYQRIEPALVAMTHDASLEHFDKAHQHTLDQLVKTALLAEVSPRLKGSGGMTVERLVRLNDFEVEGHTDRGRMIVAARDLLELSRLVPAVQVTGTGASAMVSIVLEGADFGEILERARRHVDNTSWRFRTFYGVFKPLLGLEGLPGFGEGEANDGRYSTRWRNTERRGTVCIDNVRALPYDKLRASEGEFRIVVDFPWDEPGHSVEEDRQRIYNFRKSEGSTPTYCWLPRHLSPRELSLMGDLSACEFIGQPEGQEKLLGGMAALERQQVVDLARDKARTLRAEMGQILRTAYKDHGEALALISDLSEDVPAPNLDDNLDHFASELLDRRFPTHPHFKSEPRPPELRALLDWMLQAADAADQRAAFDDATETVLRSLGAPLELVDIGQRQARLRTDSRYLREVLDRFDDSTVTWATVDNHLVESYGFQPAVRNLMLLFAARFKSYRALVERSGDPVALELDSKPKVGLRLERAPVLDPAAWSRARELGAALGDLEKPVGHRTLAAQDAWAAQVRAVLHEQRHALRQLHERISRHLPGADSPRQIELREANSRLQAVDDTTLDSFGMWTALLAAWPADDGDPLREVVRSAQADLRAVQAIDENAHGYLVAARDRVDHGAATRAHLDDLARKLGRGHDQGSLSLLSIEDWNRRAREIVKDIIGPPPPPQPPQSPPPPGKIVRTLELYAGHEIDGLDRFVDELRRRLADASRDADKLMIDVTLRVEKPEQP